MSQPIFIPAPIYVPAGEEGHITGPWAYVLFAGLGLLVIALIVVIALVVREYWRDR